MAMLKFNNALMLYLRGWSINIIRARRFNVGPCFVLFIRSLRGRSLKIPFEVSLVGYERSMSKARFIHCLSSISPFYLKYAMTRYRFSVPRICLLRDSFICEKGQSRRDVGATFVETPYWGCIAGRTHFKHVCDVIKVRSRVRCPSVFRRAWSNECALQRNLIYAITHIKQMRLFTSALCK